MTAPMTREELDEPNHDGIDFALEQLCTFLGVDPHMVSWDAATETVDGDVQAVIGNIMRAKYGEDFDPLEREGIALGDIVTMSERSPYFHDWRGIEMKVVSLRTAPDGKLWASVIEGPYDQGYRGYGSYDGETTDIDADHLSPVSSTLRGGK